jgi:two-component system, OmpR family, phosphate regulon sensor histidine kinase PhoR
MSRPYRIIFFLLTFSVLAVLGLQGYYLYNSYKDRSQQMDSRVYAALGEIGRKINERRDVRGMKERILTVRTVDHSSGVAERRSSKSAIMIGTKDMFIKHRRNVLRNVGPDLDSLMIQSEEAIQASGKALREANKALRELVVEIDTIQSVGNSLRGMQNIREDTAGLTLLINKMFREVNQLNTEENNPDSLKQVFMPILYNHGFFSDFEFAIKDLNGKKDKLLVKSQGFDDSKQAYRSDLSAERTFHTGQYLFLQLPGKLNLVLSSLKTNLILSAVFSLLILSAFFYTLKLILQQKKLGEIKNDFVNNMTHELKTPIATISLAVDAINNPIVRQDNEKFNQYTRILKEENNKLNDHVERVLQLSLIEKGGLQLRRRELDMVALVGSCIQRFKLLLEEKNGDIHFQHDTDAVMFFGDEEHLSAAICNLIDNGLKYCSTMPEIYISLKDGNEKILLTIKDNGIGISKEQQQKIFEKFYRVQGGNLHDAKGFGLGLSYVRNITEAHNGYVEVRSEINRGSEFIITLTKHA